MSRTQRRERSNWGPCTLQLASPAQRVEPAADVSRSIMTYRPTAGQEKPQRCRLTFGSAEGRAALLGSASLEGEAQWVLSTSQDWLTCQDSVSLADMHAITKLKPFHAHFHRVTLCPHIREVLVVASRPQGPKSRTN